MDDLKELFSLREEEEEEDGEEEVDEENLVYETYSQELTQHWILSPPYKSPKGRWKGFQLVQVLKSAEPHREWIEEELQQVQQLSDGMSQMRRKLMENPLQSDAKEFLLYLALVRKLSTHFHNNVSPFDSPLRGGAECSLLLYEYINFLLFALQKYYHTNIRVVSVFDSQYTEPHNNMMTICLSLLEEVRLKVYQIQSRQETFGERWEYQTSPVSIGSNDNLHQMLKSLHIQENERIRHYVRYQLGGDESIQTRITLFQIKKNEIRLAILLEKTKSLDSEQRLDMLYNRMVPWMRNITISYELLIKKFGSSNHHYLVYYAQFMSFYWVMLGDYKLAEVDWECYNVERYAEFEEAGNRALKRLEVALINIEDREKRLSLLEGPLPDYALEGLYQTLKQKIKTLEGTIRPIIEMKLGYKSGSVYLKPIEQRPFDSSQSLTTELMLETIYQEKPLFLDVFHLLDSFKSGSSHYNKPSLERKEVSTQEAHHREEEKDDRDLLEERKGWLEFLLDRRDRRGEIYLNAKRVKELEGEYQKVLQKSNNNKV